VDHSKPTVGYQDFVYKELVQFAKYDVSRSIPCIVDGFKPSQRKVLFCSFKKNLKNDIKVAQFVGYISEQSAYHHGETSLENTIVNLAQNYVGSNNLNLLVPSGQFGTRLQGGKDHAAARYIFTRLSPATRLLFHPDDDPVITYLEEEGQAIEPTWYCPILPSVLVNGADGIGVGWSTFIPNYNPRDIITNIRKMLRGEKMLTMNPWYKGFKGPIVANPNEEGKFEVNGLIEKKDEKTLEITEIPIRKWTQDYKEFLEGLMPGDTKKSEDGPSNVIEDFREYHTENTVHFVVTMTPEKMREAEKAGLEKTFKTKSSLSTANMMLFDSEGKIAKYESALDILKEFCTIRRGVYEKRKDYLVSKLRRDKEILSNKARFILMVVNEELELRKKKKDMLLKELQKLKFTPMSELNAIMKGKDNRKYKGDKKEDDAQEDAGNEETADAEKSDYDYLLGMNLWSLTYEKVEEIKKQLRIKEEELKEMQKKTIEQFWDADLNALSLALDELDAQDEAEAAVAQEYAEGRRKKVGSRAPKVPIATVARKRTKDDNKLFSQPLVTNAAADLGPTQKAISGQGEGGPTRYSAADIPLEDQQVVNRDPDVIQRPAKVPRKRAPLSTIGDNQESGSQVKASEPLPEESSGASLLQRMLANRRMSVPEPTSASSHLSLSTGSDFFFGSSASIFSSGLPEPLAASEEPDGRGRGSGDEPAKKAPRTRRKKADVDDDEDSQ